MRVDLAGDLANGAGELIGGLRAGYRILAGEDEGRHPRDTLIGGFPGLRRNQLDVFVGRETPAHVIGVEAAIGRYKRVISDTLRSRTDETEATEVAIAAAALNRMLEFGRPNYVRIA